MSNAISLLPPRNETERNAAIQRAQAQRNAAMVKVFDPENETVVDVPAGEAKAYADAGFKVGPEAEFAMEQAGILGTVATGGLALAKGATLGASDLLIPDSLKQLQQSTAQAHKVADIAGNVVGSIGALEAGGAGAAGLLARAGAARFAQLGAAATRIAMGGVQGGIEAEVDANRNNSPLTAERFLQGVGMGFLINAGGEAAGSVLAKAVPTFQKGVAKFLGAAKNKGLLNRIGVETAGGLEGTFNPGLHMEGPSLAEMDALGEEARQAFGGLKEQPPPLPTRPPSARPMPGAPDSIPGAKATLLERAKPGPTFTQDLAASRPMSEGESREAWNQLDREAADASRMGHMEGMEGVADDLRSQRDYYSANRGMGEDELGQWDAKRSALMAPDAEIDSAFDKAGFNGGGEEVSGGLTELPSDAELGLGKAVETPPGFPQGRRPKVPPLNRLGRAKKIGVPADMALPDKFGEFEQAFPDMESRVLGSDNFTPTQARKSYSIKDDKGWKSELAGDALRGGASFGLLHLIPVVGPKVSATLSGSQAAFHVARRALVGTLNHEAQFNAVLERVMAPAMKLTGHVVKTAIQGASPYISSGYLTGDTDAEYSAIAKGAQNAAADPAMLEGYYQGRYGDMMAHNPELYGNIVAQSAKQHAYLASQVPKDPRENPGILEPDYDPPRSDKVKLVEAYKAVNDPYSVLANPTADGVAHVQATHPETLALVQKILLGKLVDPKVAKKLTPSQTARLSILLQMPVTARDSDQFLGMIQQLAAANGAPPPPQGGNGNNGQGNGPPNLGGQQTAQFASQLAPPSQQQQLEDLR